MGQTDGRTERRADRAIPKCPSRAGGGRQTRTWFVERRELLVKSLDAQMLHLRTVVVADRLARGAVEALVLERCRQRPRRHADDRRILLVAYDSLRNSPSSTADHGRIDTHRRKLLLGPGANPPPTFMIMGLAYTTSPPLL